MDGPLLLRGRDGRGALVEVPLAAPVTVLGAGPPLDGPAVGGRHVAVIRQDREALLADLGGTARALVNGAPVAPGATVPLRPGDRLDLGAVMLTLHDAAPAAAEPAGLRIRVQERPAPEATVAAPGARPAAVVLAPPSVIRIGAPSGDPPGSTGPEASTPAAGAPPGAAPVGAPEAARPAEGSARARARASAPPAAAPPRPGCAGATLVLGALLLAGSFGLTHRALGTAREAAGRGARPGAAPPVDPRRPATEAPAAPAAAPGPVVSAVGAGPAPAAVDAGPAPAPVEDGPAPASPVGPPGAGDGVEGPGGPTGPAPSEAAALLAERLVGRPPAAAELGGLGRDPARWAAWIAAQAEGHARWWAAELEAFGVAEGPAEAWWDAVPGEVVAGRRRPLDALRDLARGRAFARAHAGERPFAAAVAGLLLGLAPETPARREVEDAARHVAAGWPGPALGVAARTPRDVLEAALGEGRFTRAAVARALDRALDRAPTGAEVDAAVVLVLGAPGDARALQRAAAEVALRGGAAR